MNRRNLSKETLLVEIETLLFEIKHAKEYLAAFNALNKAYSEYRNVMCKAKRFFSLCKTTFIDDFTAETIKVYDQNSYFNIISLCDDFIEYSYNNALLDAEGIKALRYFLEFKRKNKTIKNLKIRRNKYYFHTDKEYILNYEKEKMKTTMSFNDMEELLKQAEALCLSLYKSIAHKDWDGKLFRGCLEPERDPNDLFNLLKMTNIEA